MYYLRNAGESGKSAQLATQYTQGGYRDWFLPSKDELHLIYTNLRLQMLGDYSMDCYWSSSTSEDDTSTWCQMFSDGRQLGVYSMSRDQTYSVRPIRQF